MVKFGFGPRKKYKGFLLFAKAISVSMVFLIMTHALTIDWASKSEQDFTNGYVVPFVASPARINMHTAFLCRVGRCPVIDCSRELVTGKRVRYGAVNGSSCTVKVLGLPLVQHDGQKLGSGKLRRRKQPGWC